MKVQCDVCKREEAAVFCCADEAALCGPCDGHVHGANKLAGKHRRFSLVHPDSRLQFPFCDICKEKPALLFCQEDRAILCRDCDASIHDANDLTRKHCRFFLTGIGLSPFAAPAAPKSIASSSDVPSSVAAASPTTTASADGEHSPATVNKPKQHMNSKAVAATAAGLGNGNMVVKYMGLCSRASAAAPASATATTTGGSIISEYLMRELPGWQVEDLLLDSFPVAQPAATFDFQMPGEDPMLSGGEDPNATATGGAFQPECRGGKVPAWLVPKVPQFPAAPAPSPLVLLRDHGQQQHHATSMGAGGQLTELLSGTAPALVLATGATAPPPPVHDGRGLHRSRIHRNLPSYKRSRPSSWAALPCPRGHGP